MNKKPLGKYTREKYNLKNRKLPFMVRLRTNWQRMKKHNIHKSFQFILACFIFSLVVIKSIQFFIFSRAFLIAIPREEFEKNHLINNMRINKNVDQEVLNNYLDILEEMKIQRERQNIEKNFKL